MKLPHGQNAFVDPKKLLEYCLNAQHPRGRNKARVFAAVGIQASDAAALREAVLAAAATGDAKAGEANLYGQRYTIDFEFRAVRIRSAWIVRDGDHLPRLTSCYEL